MDYILLIVLGTASFQAPLTTIQVPFKDQQACIAAGNLVMSDLKARSEHWRDNLKVLACVKQ